MKKFFTKIFKNFKWENIRILLLFLSMIFLFSFSNKINENRKIERIEVDFLGDEKLFITSQNVNNLLKQSFPKTSNVNKSVIDLNNLEIELRKHNLIESAQVYITVDGVLTAEIVQKEAIGRVISINKSHYIDSKGNDMPMSDNYSVRVPVIQGVVNDENREDIKRVLKLINEDEFLKKSITGIMIQPNQMLVMKSRNHRFDILFGNCNEIERKFANYKAFMHYGTNDTLIENYKTINLKFTQQVVCTKF